MKTIRHLFATLALATLMAGPSLAYADDLVVYSARNEHLIKTLFEEYTKETGTSIAFVTDDAGALLQRLKAEGENTPADLLITVDAGNLWHAAREGVLQAIDSEVLRSNIPENLRDPGHHWYGLSIRARTIVYSTERVKPEELSTYEDLGSPAWKGRLVLRTSKKVYNQSLVAMLIAEHGEAETEKIVKSWVDNLATAPFSNDTKTMEAISAGQGDVGVVNTYYFGRMLMKNPGLKLALFWPNQKTGGVHVNISGAGVTRYTKNKDAAVKFLEWLSSAKAQKLFAEANMEYPVNQVVAVHPYVAAWGDFKASEQNLALAGQLQETAIKLMDRAGYR